jgi:alpha-glucosidase
MNPEPRLLRFCSWALCALFLPVFSPLASAAPASVLKSPDGRIELKVDLSSKIYYSVNFDAIALLKPSPLTLELGDGTVLGANPALKETRQREQRGEIRLPWGRNQVLADVYNEIELRFAGDFSVVFRAYNDGVAYRFRSARSGELLVRAEELQWNLAAGGQVWVTDYNTMAGSFEGLYAKTAFADWKAGSYAYSPILIEHSAGPRLLLCDADLSDYPGLYLQKVGETGYLEIKGLFAKFPKATRSGGWCHFDRVVTETQDYIAKTQGTRDFPWRVTIIAASDRELLDSELVMKLARPSQLADTGWLQPGHASWEWWNDWNLAGEDFRTGINTATYRRYVDFAAENKIPYLVVDEGWSDPSDMALLNPDLDIKAVIDYARSKGVKIVLWCTWKALVDQWDSAFARFSDWGIAGIKVDFFDRDDQVAMASVEAIAKEAAARHLFVDYHGCRPLPGFARTYPNAFNFEGVRGNEYNKFSKEPPHPAYNATLPFTRGMVGPMDFTPGAMRNVLAADFAPSNSSPVAIGTRCHQLAMYVLYAAPLQMLCDSPSAYRQAPDFLSFLCGIPVTWDESRALESRVGEYAVIARRSSSTWYVGALGGAAGRKLSLDLGFLGAGSHRVTLASDGVNADKLPTDYRIQTLLLDAGKPFEVTLAPGGGAVLAIDAGR